MRRNTVTLTVLTLVLYPAIGVWGGPPAVCQPIDIGSATSLPFGDGPLKPGELSLSEVVPRTLEILEASDDALVHMETLRRAAIYVRESQREIDRLCDALKARIGGLKKVAEETQGLAWFDLGYAQGALGQLRKKWSQAERYLIVGCFEKAVSLRRDDGAVYLGASLASWGEEPKVLVHRFFAKALHLSRDPDGLLRKNLLIFGNRFYGGGSYEELIAKMEGRR